MLVAVCLCLKKDIQVRGECETCCLSEPNSFWKKAHILIDGLQLGEDFVELHKLLQRSAFQNAKLYGPDIGQPRGKTVKLLRR
jgi:hypothetical protein